MDSPIPPSTSPPPERRPKTPEMISTISTIPDEAPAAAPTVSRIPDEAPAANYSLFDWSDFLDFGIDDPFTALSFDSDQQQEKPIETVESEPVLHRVEDTGRTRKRDPRLVCSNFLAGRVPCACPELDEKLEQEEEMVLGGPGKKRARTVRLPAGSMARCQVPGCEADISELKGYHRRHRVCLRCANASAVFLDGQSKRYCQQCGKFHILSDFDEGKRSCRRKLERHNNRRRRKPADGKGIEKEPQQAMLSGDVCFDDDTLKDSVCLSSQMAEGEMFVESEGQLSTQCSAHHSQNNQTDSIVSFAAFDEIQTEGEKEILKQKQSPSHCENKSAFSSVCPTGRISFKLYDWNPAEFPRRLRHQIFEWLASMPVELEGYIRPGCTILTIFIAMPKSMWTELYEEPALHLHDFVMSPGNMLSGQGTFFAYLNDMIFGIMKDGTSVMKVKAKEQTPQLHYVHPTCFEAGKPMEFVACGSNLLQPKLRFLVSFAGKYLAYNMYVSSSCSTTKGDAGSLNHQLLKISVPQTVPNLFGPAFVEVENESGLSNFIPVLIADKDICGEVNIMQQRFDASLCHERPEFVVTSSSCQGSASRQTDLSEFITDVAWFLKKPCQETLQLLTSTQIKRINNLFHFLIENESTAILDRVLYYVRTLFDSNLNAEIAGADMEILRTNMDNARGVLSQKLQAKGYPVTHLNKLFLGEISLRQSYQNDLLSVVPSNNQGPEFTETSVLETRVALASLESSTTSPLLKGEVVTSVNINERAAKFQSPLLTKTRLSSWQLIFVITAAAVCFGVCVALFHPQKVGKLAITIRRCLLDKS